MPVVVKDAAFFGDSTGDPPARPGLLRVATGGGRHRPRNLECPPLAWSIHLPILAQLGGSVVLEDGSAVLGFLCESYATEGARDITAMGGWRAYLESIA
jgi:allophanate hydrolase